MKSEQIYRWDAHSDQPHVIKDKQAKRALYWQGLGGSLKTVLTSVALPFVGIKLLFQSRTRVEQTINMLGLCVNIDTPLPQKTPVSNEHLWQFVSDLGIKDLQVRIPLWDINNLTRYVDLVRGFTDCRVLITVLQDRPHIEDSALLRRDLTKIFEALHTQVSYFQIGNAVNRRKWAFASLDEYFQFFRTAQRLRDDKFPHLKLLGSGVIDFELPNFARSLFHAYPIKYDGAAALLYVDRRGAPENTQLQCDLITKINWFYEMVRLSPKSANRLWITEVNWPLKGTEPYAPATGDCMVDERLQAAYLVRYFLLAIANGKVEKCFWHQLIAPGYGLIDNRDGQLRKRPAYDSFKTLINLFDGGRVIRFTRDQHQLYRLRVHNQRGLVEAVWANGNEHDITVESQWRAHGQTGAALPRNTNAKLHVSDEVVYLLNYANG